MIRAIADNGLPLKITAEWTENDYWDRQHEDTDDLTFRRRRHSRLDLQVHTARRKHRSR